MAVFLYAGVFAITRGAAHGIKKQPALLVTGRSPKGKYELLYVVIRHSTFVMEEADVPVGTGGYHSTSSQVPGVF